MGVLWGRTWWGGLYTKLRYKGTTNSNLESLTIVVSLNLRDKDNVDHVGLAEEEIPFGLSSSYCIPTAEPRVLDLSSPIISPPLAPVTCRIAHLYHRNDLGESQHTHRHIYILLMGCDATSLFFASNFSQWRSGNPLCCVCLVYLPSCIFNLRQPPSMWQHSRDQIPSSVMFALLGEAQVGRMLLFGCYRVARAWHLSRGKTDSAVTSTHTLIRHWGPVRLQRPVLGQYHRCRGLCELPQCLVGSIERTTGPYGFGKLRNWRLGPCNHSP